MKFQLGELETLFCSIKDIVDYIEHVRYENRRYKLYLSNGEYLNFSIPNSAIPHLLGIDTTYLSSTNIFKTTSSFELLKELIENPYRIDKLEKDGIIKYDKLFSPFIVNKVNAFMENIKINIQDVEFICKYEPEKTYKINDEAKNYNYLIIKKLSNDRYGMICLVRNNGFFAPMSNQIFDDYESLMAKLKEVIRFQEITIINGIEVFNTVDDYHNFSYLKLYDKSQKLHNLKKYKMKFESSIDVSSDCEYYIDKLQQHRSNKDETDILIDKMVDSIKKGEIIKEYSDENSYLLPIINAFNDFICSNNLTENSENNQTYSSLISKLKKFENRIKELEVIKSDLIDINTNLDKENKALSQENSDLKEKQEKIYEILKPRTN